MILIEEAIQRVQSLYSKGAQSKDSRLTDRHIYSCLISGRSTVLQQKANKNQYISHWNYQSLSCIGLELAPLHDCPCAPAGITILRSKHKLPRLISSLDQALIQRVSSLDGSIVFDKKEFESFKYTRGRRFSSVKPFFFIRNEYLYIGIIKKLEAVSLIGLFHDPYEVYLYPSSCDDCDECNCKSPFELEFPIDGDLLKTVVQIANTETTTLLQQIKDDTHNDASDASSIKGNMLHQNDQGN